MNSTVLKLSGIILCSMIPFTCTIAELIEFENVVYEKTTNIVHGSIFSFYGGGLEYVEKDDSSVDENINCLVDDEKSTSNTIAVQPEFEKVVYKRSIGDRNNKVFLDIDLEYFRMKGDSTVAINFNCLTNYFIYQDTMSSNVPADTPEDYVRIAIQDFEYFRKNNPEERGGHSQYTQGEITWSDNKLISMEHVTSLYTGGAHPHSYHNFLNVDPKTGKRIDILDFITDKKALITAVHEKLIQALPDGQKHLWNQVPLPKHLGMTDDGLKLVYNEYEILSYGDGRTEILIPMDELKVFSVF